MIPGAPFTNSDFYLSMKKYLQPLLGIVVWNLVSISKLQRFSRCSLEMD